MDRLERAKKFAVNVSDWWDTHKRMADFAESEVRAERARIAAELRDRHAVECRLPRVGFCHTCNFIEELEAENNERTA